MQGVLVDSNVILDVMTEDPQWFDWSATIMENLAERHVLYINPVIYAEISVGFQTIEELENVLQVASFKRLHLPWEASFLAGKIFLQYRKKGSVYKSPLPDFFIGSHAMISNLLLLTRDNKRYRHYFPKLQIKSPL